VRPVIKADRERSLTMPDKSHDVFDAEIRAALLKHG